MKKKITLPPGKIGIFFVGSPPCVTKVSDTSPLLGLLDVGDVITELIIPGAIELTGMDTSAVSSFLGKYSAVEGRVLVVQSNEQSSSPDNPGGFGSHIILKKTWKVKEYSYAADKHFTFHGIISPTVVDAVNANLEKIRPAGGQQRLRFALDGNGHYIANMTHDYQKLREEDAIVCIMDSMSAMGYRFTKQFDSETASMKVLGGDSYTNKEMWLFQKD